MSFFLFSTMSMRVFIVRPKQMRVGLLTGIVMLRALMDDILF
jgi:hypothetical protein